jgi:hypothetical protein
MLGWSAKILKLLIIYYEFIQGLTNSTKSVENNFYVCTKKICTSLKFYSLTTQLLILVP